MKYLNPKFSVPPPEKVTCCEACVYGRGEHAEWCDRASGVQPPRFAGMEVRLDPSMPKDAIGSGIPKRQPDNPTDWQAWKWKAAAFRRVLRLCKTEESAEQFIAQEFAGIYEVGLIHGRLRVGFVDRGIPTYGKED